METNKLTGDKKKHPTVSHSEEGGNLLRETKILVARFSRHKMAILFAIVSILVGIGAVSELTPKKIILAQEDADSAAKNAPDDTRPGLPAGVASAAGRYDETNRGTGAVTSATRSKPERDSLQGEAQSRTGDPPAGSLESHTPAQLLARASTDQRHKDYVSATRAPVSFSGGNARLQEAAPVRELALNLPDAGGVNKMIDRLAAVQGSAEPDDQNQQGEKRGFTKENRSDFPYLKTALLTPISPYEVKAGTILPGVLITGINSDLPGQITAQARENVYDTVSGRYLLIPMGSRFIGEYDSKVSYGQERILVVWTRIVMPNGNSISLENMPGIDLSGYAGVSGRVNNHYVKLVTGVVLGSVLGAGAQVAVGGQGAPNVPPSFGQLFTAGAAGNLNQAGQRITEKNLNLQPTIEVSPGQKVNIFVTKDMILKPYVD